MQKLKAVSPRQACSWLVRTFRISFTHAALISVVGACPKIEMGASDQKHILRFSSDTLKDNPRN